MKRTNSLRIFLFTLGGIFTVCITMAALIPCLRFLLKVEEPVYQPPEEIAMVELGKPEEELLTVIYQMKPDTKRIDAIYIEVFRPGSETVYYIQVPVDTKMTLSTELYAGLQTYAPELPQYMKLSRMAETFSDEYALTGCNRILSELLGMSFVHYIRAEEKQVLSWMQALQEETDGTGFFNRYTDWLTCEADLSQEERWMYYESYVCAGGTEMETAPGTQGADGYNLSAKQTRELLEDMRNRMMPWKERERKKAHE